MEVINRYVLGENIHQFKKQTNKHTNENNDNIGSGVWATDCWMLEKYIVKYYILALIWHFPLNREESVTGKD